jgi:hypothetical protein
MYYRDLQPYRYGLPVDLLDVVTVGWLSPSNKFPISETNDQVLDAIRHLLTTSRTNKMRGYHLCEFCRLVEPAKVELPGGSLTLGSLELWVPSNVTTRIYAAPDLIYHYISVHHYSPPEEFITAAIGARTRDDWNPSMEREKRVRAAFVS